jgi:GNAT superfamily N-acetyltransferase
MAMMDCICGARLTGADDDALFAALRQHNAELHPEQGVTDDLIRSWIAAQTRMTPWDGKRIDLPEQPRIVPLTRERAGDMLTFFDRDAFMDNPIWADCYCLYPQFDGTQEEWAKKTADENRAAKADLVKREASRGLLAYAGDRVVAWCHAAPRRMLPMFDRQPRFAADDADVVGSIVCFVVAAPYRGQGIARLLLDAACGALRDEGMAVAEAYPLRDPASAARAHLGTVGMYRAAGFAEHRDAGRAVVMRKPLQAPTG